MKSLLEQIESRLAVCAKATPGPWHQSAAEKRNLVIQTAHITRDVWTIARTDHDCEVNSAFIAASRNQREGELAALKVAAEALECETPAICAISACPCDNCEALAQIASLLGPQDKLLSEGK